MYKSLYGEMAEWSKAVASKAIISRNRDRGFESLSLRHILFQCNQFID